MLSLLGFTTIIVFLILIMTKKMSVMTALVITPIVFGLLAGFNPKELGEFSLTGIKQVAPTGILLMFAVLYFATMLDAGLFDPVIAFIIKSVKGDPLKVIIGTAILTMIVHLDGDGTATFMIVLSAFLPIYKQLKINRLVLIKHCCIERWTDALSSLVGNFSKSHFYFKIGCSTYFQSKYSCHFGRYCLGAFCGVLLGKKERKRLGIIDFQYNHKENLTEEQHGLRRPKLLIFNAILTIIFDYCLNERLDSCPCFICGGKYDCLAD